MHQRPGKVKNNQNAIPYEAVASAVKLLLEPLSEALSSGERIEIRGFGSFSLQLLLPWVGRNPKTGDPGIDSTLQAEIATCYSS